MSKFDNFVNNVYCRRESNQHKAYKLWEELKDSLPIEVSNLFRVDWIHYMNDEFTPKDFGACIERLKSFLNK